MEYSLAVKRNEVRIHATTWMNLKGIMLREKDQSQKTTLGMVPFIWNVPKRQIYRHRLTLGLGRVEGEMRSDPNGYRVFLGGREMKMLWNVLGWWSNSVNILKPTELYTLNGWVIGYMNYSSTKLFLSENNKNEYCAHNKNHFCKPKTAPRLHELQPFIQKVRKNGPQEEHLCVPLSR